MAQKESASCAVKKIRVTGRPATNSSVQFFALARFICAASRINFVRATFRSPRFHPSRTTQKRGPSIPSHSLIAFNVPFSSLRRQEAMSFAPGFGHFRIDGHTSAPSDPACPSNLLQAFPGLCQLLAKSKTPQDLCQTLIHILLLRIGERLLRRIEHVRIRPRLPNAQLVTLFPVKGAVQIH